MLTASVLILAFLGATPRSALRICRACEVGLEQTRCTQLWFFGCEKKKEKFF